MQDPRAARLGEELGAEADQPARGHEEVEPNPAGAVVDHVLHAALAQGEHLRDHAEEVLRHVDREPLDRLVQLAVDLARDHLRLADRQLEALAPHRLDEHGELQLAAALHLPGVAAVGVHHADRDVAHQLPLEPVLHHARGQPRARLAGQRRVVDPDRHAQRRLVDRDHGQRPRVVGVGDRLADRDLGDAGEGDDLAGAGLVGGHAREPLVHVELGRRCTFSTVPSRLIHATCWPLRIVPWCTRQSASRPTYGSASRFVTRA